jgi:hypothetical protein
MAQWVPSFESYHGGVCSLGEGGSRVFAGAQGGAIFSSTDYGNTWNLITAGEIKNDVISIGAADSLEFAGTNGGGIFCRETNGGPWRRQSNGLSDTIVNAILIRGRGNIIAGTEHGIFVSSNNGDNWIPHVFTFGEKPVLALTQNDSGVFAGTAQGIIYFSSDLGGTWVQRGSIMNHKIASLDIFGKKVLAGTADSGVFISIDCGFSWTEANTGLLNLNIAGLTSTDSKIYAATWMGGGGSFVSGDSGNTWTPLMSLPDSILTAVLAIGHNVFVSSLMLFSGVFQSSDDGGSWTQANLGGITNHRINSFAKVGSNIFAGTGGGGVLRTTDLGKTWSPTGVNYLYVNSLGGNDSIVLAGASPGIWRSSDNGLSWSIADSDWNGVCYHILFHDSTFYAAYGFNIHISRDGGLTWHILGLPQGVFETANDIAVIDSSIFVGSGTLGVLRSTNDGRSWIRCGSPSNIYCMGVKDSMLFIGTSNGVYKSSDDGGTWASAGLSSDFIFTIVSFRSYLFAGTDQGLFFSRDNGNTWTFEGEGLDKYVEAILIVDSMIYAGTSGDGVLERKLSEITTGIRGGGDQLPSQFTLHQNYPNPFNPTTVISYRLAVNTFVTLKVYDELGRLVKTLVEDRQTAGIHSATFNASNLSSGVYFYRLNAGSFVNTKKLFVIK